MGWDAKIDRAVFTGHAQALGQRVGCELRLLTETPRLRVGNMKTSPNRRAIYHYAEQFPELLMVNEVYIKTTPPSCFEVRGAGRGAAFFFSPFSRPLPSPRRRKVGEPNVTRGGVLQNKCGFSFKEMCRYRYLLNVGSNGYANKLKCAAAAHGSSPTCSPAAPPLTAAPLTAAPTNAAESSSARQAAGDSRPRYLFLCGSVVIWVRRRRPLRRAPFAASAHRSSAPQVRTDSLNYEFFEKQFLPGVHYAAADTVDDVPDVIRELQRDPEYARSLAQRGFERMLQMDTAEVTRYCSRGAFQDMSMTRPRRVPR